jgi:hypothetical protein
MNSKIVMNNVFLRKKIFSYFKNEYIICYKCKKICKYNKNIIRKYIEIPICDFTVIFHSCLKCYWSSNTLEIMGR